ncbi:hypothetical protein OHV08_29760 [Streptomyces canus]|uniref:hypothetical protein n=1 Tax=Streptomyces canus TaxID=58343 RepID=UPI00324396A7
MDVTPEGQDLAVVDGQHTLDDVVILVHGTWAGDAEHQDEGHQWWQRGSDFWRWLECHLPGGVSLPDSPIKLFHWDGMNSQVARLEAGNRLLALLLELESQGRGYHLVGHSHGGSIIWDALVSAEITYGTRTVHPDLRRAFSRLDAVWRGTLLAPDPLLALRYDEYAPAYVKFKTRYLSDPREFAAVRQLIELPGLRSWTTVGTPFLHHLPKRRLFVRGWRHPAFTLNPDARQRLLSDITDDLLRLMLLVPFLAIIPLAFLGQRLAHTWYGDVLTAFLAADLVGSFVALGRRIYANVLLTRARCAQGAMDRFGERWLGLWAREDEAITALRQLAEPTGDHHTYEWLCTPPSRRDAHPPPRGPASEWARKLLKLKVPIADAHLVPHVMLLSPARLATPAVRAYNRFVRPALGRKMIGVLRRAGQGNDLPHAQLVHVSPWPVPVSLPEGLAGLPVAVGEEIEFRANDHGGKVGTVARELFMMATLEGVPEARRALADAGGDGALVHTSYFDHIAVRRLIALHIRQHAAVDDGLRDEDDLSSWLHDNAATVRATWTRFRSHVGPD